MNLTFYFALARIPLGIAVALEFTGPMAVAIFTSKYKMDYLWALLAGFGIYLLLPLSGATNLDFVGVFWALAAGFFWALYIVFGKKAGNDFHGGLATTIGMTFAAMVAIPAGVIAAGPKLLDVSLWPYGFGVALLSSAIPYSLEMLSLKSMPTKTFGVLMSLEPAIAAFAGLLSLVKSFPSLNGSQSFVSSSPLWEARSWPTKISSKLKNSPFQKAKATCHYTCPRRLLCKRKLHCSLCFCFLSAPSLKLN
jgi:threonine/homoserine efflux transporter RhtA